MKCPLTCKKTSNQNLKITTHLEKNCFSRSSYKKLSFVLGDGRAVTIEFSESIHGTLLTEYFEPEQENNLDLQRSGWQAILKNLAQD